MNSFRVSFQMSNQIFDFTPNTCLYQGTAFTIVGSPVYSPARVDFYFSGDLTLATHIFKCKITNPNYVATGSLNVKTMQYDANNIIELKNGVGTFSTLAASWGISPLVLGPPAGLGNENLKIYLGWGVNVA